MNSVVVDSLQGGRLTLLFREANVSQVLRLSEAVLRDLATGPLAQQDISCSATPDGVLLVCYPFPVPGMDMDQVAQQVRDAFHDAARTVH